MEKLKLTINLLPKGAWNNDFSKTLPKKDWDKLRMFALKRAGGKCEICGFKTNELDVHEEWDFDTQNKTQTLKQIIAICSKCHGVKHFKNSVRLGHGEEAEKHLSLSRLRSITLRSSMTSERLSKQPAPALSRALSARRLKLATSMSKVPLSPSSRKTARS